MFTIDSISQTIQSKFSSFVKKGVSINPHFVPLNLQVLERTLGSIIRNESDTQFNASRFRNTLYVNIRNKFSNTIILTPNSFSVNGRKDVSLADLMSKFTPALVFTNNNSKDNLVGVLFNSYQAAGASLLTSDISKFINDQLKGLVSDLDLAYIFRSPQEENKLKNFLGIFNSISKNTISSSEVNIPNDKSGVLQSQIMVESLLKDYAVYEERELGTYSIAISKEVSNFVTSIRANIIILHDTKAKAKVREVVESKGFISTIAKLLPNVKVAKSTFIEDIKSKIKNIFLGRPDKASKGTQKTSSKITGTKASLKFSAEKGLQSELIIPPGFRSLVNLQNLINANLAEAIKDNMGTGDSKDILNYRTGRLANSFKVTGVSQDREGALTAFFTYMKYPYATFSKGGLQEDPRSRDPILLGNNAIRDIAMNIIHERLRAIGI